MQMYRDGCDQTAMRYTAMAMVHVVSCDGVYRDGDGTRGFLR